MIHLKNLPRRINVETTGARLEKAPYQVAVGIAAKLGLTVQDYISAGLEEINQRHTETETSQKPAKETGPKAVTWDDKPTGFYVRRGETFRFESGWTLGRRLAKAFETLDEAKRFATGTRDVVIENRRKEGGDR